MLHAYQQIRENLFTTNRKLRLKILCLLKTKISFVNRIQDQGHIHVVRILFENNA